MSDQHHMSRQSDDEEEDLEILRLAALKSLHSKKDSSASAVPYFQTSQQRNIAPAYGVGHLPTGTPYVNNDNLKGCYYVSDHNMPTQATLPNLADNYDTRQRLEKLDINEPYVPQHIAPINSGVPVMSGANGWVPEPTSINNGYVPYIPRKATETVGLGVNNVQLSPRSLAFVAENNDILMRRKGENVSPNYIRSPCRSPCKSPPYRPPVISYRSPSPIYIPQSPGRWSITPPPKSSSRSPPPRNRVHHYSNRRSMSRSLPPSRGRSPINRRRTPSRSPPPLAPSSRHASPYRYSPRSPKYPNHKRMKSRSPLRPRNKTPPRRLSRSPIPPPRHSAKSKSPLNITGRRRSSPAARHFNKTRPSPVHQKRSSSHDTGECRQPHRPRSPQNHMPNIMRSRSRSPVRKFPRRSRDRNVTSSQPVRRRSPYNNGRRRIEGSTNGYRNRGRKRSGSPILQNRRKFSRSKTPEKGRRDENRSRKPERNARKFDESQRVTKYEDKEKERNIDNNSKVHLANGNQARELKKIEEGKQNEESKKVEIIHNSFEAIMEDSQDKLENVESESEKKREISSDEGNEENSTDESDDDGIDLFPSDESESENEGRFKLCTSKKERDESVSTPSFTKLGESSIPDLVKDLKDIGTSSNSKSNNSGKEDRDRERSNYESKRRDDRFRKSDGRNSRNDRRRGNNSNSNSRREYEESTRPDDKRRADKPMFKSTFQAIDSDGRSSGKSTDEKDLNERKSSVQVNKRRLHVKDKGDSPGKETLSEKLSSVVTSNPGSNGGGSTGAGGKKPIHLRLGAMTNTFKAPKKSSTWSSSSDKLF